MSKITSDRRRSRPVPFRLIPWTATAISRCSCPLCYAIRNVGLPYWVVVAGAPGIAEYNLFLGKN